MLYKISECPHLCFCTTDAEFSKVRPHNFPRTRRLLRLEGLKDEAPSTEATILPVRLGLEARLEPSAVDYSWDIGLTKLQAKLRRKAERRQISVRLDKVSEFSHITCASLDERGRLPTTGEAPEDRE